jgi:GTP-binding protein EngB required for normal cell division
VKGSPASNTPGGRGPNFTGWRALLRRPPGTAARAPKTVRERGADGQGFLAPAEAIALAIVLGDARHTPSDLDVTMLEWLVDRDIPRIVVGVKADKLSGNQRKDAERALAAAFPTAEDGVAPLLVSAVSGFGMKDLWRQVDAALAAHGRRDQD